MKNQQEGKLNTQILLSKLKNQNDKGVLSATDLHKYSRKQQSCWNKEKVENTSEIFFVLSETNLSSKLISRQFITYIKNLKWIVTKFSFFHFIILSPAQHGAKVKPLELEIAEAFAVIAPPYHQDGVSDSSARTQFHSQLHLDTATVTSTYFSKTCHQVP